MDDNANDEFLFIITTTTKEGPYALPCKYNTSYVCWN